MLSDLLTLDLNNNSPNDSIFKFTNISLALLSFDSDSKSLRQLL